MRRFLLALLAVAGSSPVAAQELQPRAMRLAEAEMLPSSPAWNAAQADPAKHEFAVRSVSGIAGSFAGLLAGGIIGYGMPDRECGDDPGLCEMVAGMLIGTVTGAALGAALPKRGSTCGFGGRAALGVVGAILFGLGGAVVGAQGDSQWVLLTTPLGAGFGGAIGASLC